MALKFLPPNHVGHSLGEIFCLSASFKWEFFPETEIFKKLYLKIVQECKIVKGC